MRQYLQEAAALLVTKAATPREECDCMAAIGKLLAETCEEVDRLRKLLADLVEAAYREGMEDGRDGWCNERESSAPSDRELWLASAVNASLPKSPN